MRFIFILFSCLKILARHKRKCFKVEEHPNPIGGPSCNHEGLYDGPPLMKWEAVDDLVKESFIINSILH